jgi:hypothetical protein
MAILKSNLLLNHKKPAKAGALESHESSPTTDVEMTADEQTLNAEVVDSGIDGLKGDAPRNNVQTGVQKIQAVTLTWSKTSMLSILCLYAPPLATNIPIIRPRIRINSR